MARPQIADFGVRTVALVGFVAVIYSNSPGHLTYDSIAQLHEGRTGIRETWGPAFYSWLLGTCDRLITGTSFYVFITAGVFFGSLATLPRLRTRVSWWAVVAAIAACLTPHVLIGQGIVWKDIAFANAAVAGLIALAHAERSWDERPLRWTALAITLCLLAFAAQLRQNGAIVGVIAALGLGVIASRGNWQRGAAWTAGATVVYLITIQLLGMASLATLKVNPSVPTGAGVVFGIRLIQSYDLAGAVTHDRSYDLDVVERATPEAAQTIEDHAPGVYSPQRVDLLDRDPALSAAMNTVTNDAIMAQWIDLVSKRPDLYLRTRVGIFRWLIAPPIIDACLPITVGVSASPEVLQKAGLAARRTQQDGRLYNYTTWFLDTPVYSHGFYAVLSAAMSVVFLWRRRSGDLAMASLQFSSLAVAASFFVINIACDWRYLYFTDLAAMVGVIYFALDFRLPRRRRVGRNQN